MANFGDLSRGHLKLFAARTVFLPEARVCVVEYSKWMCENGMIGDFIYHEIHHQIIICTVTKHKGPVKDY